MKTVTHGYLIPEEGDNPQQIRKAIAENFERLADHVHEGEASTKLSLSLFPNVSQSLEDLVWEARDTNTGLFHLDIDSPTDVAGTLGERAVTFYIDGSRYYLDYQVVEGLIVRVFSNVEFPAMLVVYA